MNRDKQIEEMAKYLHGNFIAYDTRWLEDCRSLAISLYDAGYRKSTEVAEDIIRMLRAAGINEWRYPIVADIKKKYTESEKDK